jgi:hypothetical protein
VNEVQGVGRIESKAHASAHNLRHAFEGKIAERSAAAPFVDGDASSAQRGRIETSIRLEQRPTPKQIAGTKCAIA